MMKIKEIIFVDKSKSRRDSIHSNEYHFGFILETDDGKEIVHDSFCLRKGYSTDMIKNVLRRFLDTLTITDYQVEGDREFKLQLPDDDNKT